MVTLKMPHEYTLKNGEIVTIKMLKSDEHNEYYDFLQNLKADDKLYLKYNVSNPGFVKERVETIDKGTRISIVAWTNENKIVGSSTIYWSHFGWKAHVGKFRLIVARDYRNQGLSKYLAQLGFYKAQELNLSVLMAEMMKEQKVAKEIFESLGFKKEAILRNFIIDNKGKMHDMLIMTAHLTDLMDKYESMILDEESKGG